jgi:hypothetical protein
MSVATAPGQLAKRVAALPMTESAGLRQLKRGARRVRERYALATWEDRVLPELLLVGAQRCGTTALTEALHRLPMVERPRRGKGSHFFSYNYVKGWPWFQSQFPTTRTAARVAAATGSRLVCFDACPYYLFHPFALDRLAHHLPDAKLLVMLRDPVDRAISHYHHSVANGHEDLDLEAALDAEADRLDGEMERMQADQAYWSHSHEHHSYLAKGHYAGQLERLLALFPQEQLTVVQAEAFYRDPAGQLARVTDWLGLPAVDLADTDDRNGHEYRPIDTAERRRLAERFVVSNEALYQLLGERFDWTAP